MAKKRGMVKHVKVKLSSKDKLAVRSLSKASQKKLLLKLKGSGEKTEVHNVIPPRERCGPARERDTWRYRSAREAKLAKR